jgi:hypothetical protein
LFKAGVGLKKADTKPGLRQAVALADLAALERAEPPTLIFDETCSLGQSSYQSDPKNRVNRTRLPKCGGHIDHRMKASIRCAARPRQHALWRFGENHLRMKL